MDGEQDLVDDLPAVGDAPKLLDTGGQLHNRSARAEDLPGDGDGPRSAKAEDGDCALAKWSGDGGNGLLGKWRGRFHLTANGEAPARQTATGARAS